MSSHGLFSPILPFVSTLGHDIPLIYLPLISIMAFQHRVFARRVRRQHDPVDPGAPLSGSSGGPGANGGSGTNGGPGASGGIGSSSGGAGSGSGGSGSGSDGGLSSTVSAPSPPTSSPAPQSSRKFYPTFYSL